jgi:hypothetical protein
MSNAHQNDKDIKELQRLAQSAPLAPRKRRERLSRAAQFAAIDLLSRWSAAGLALIAGVGVYLSITVGRDYPTRAAAWALMLLAALWVCRRLQSQYRSGAAFASRPFRWRASFTSCLCVLGVAFASAPILLTPAGAEPSMAVQTTALSLMGAFGAAIFFAAHLNSAAALAAPGALFPLLAAWRAGDPTAAVIVFLAAAAGAGAIVAVQTVIATKLKTRHPRTRALRSEFDETHDRGDIYGEGRQTA